MITPYKLNLCEILIQYLIDNGTNCVFDDLSRRTRVTIVRSVRVYSVGVQYVDVTVTDLDTGRNTKQSFRTDMDLYPLYKLICLKVKKLTLVRTLSGYDGLSFPPPHLIVTRNVP